MYLNQTKNSEEPEYNCAYCGALTEYDEEDNTWSCENPKCWAKKVEGTGVYIPPVS